MNLIIDVGNTNGKIAVFNHNKIIEVATIKTSNTINRINIFTQKYNSINRAIISNVSTSDNQEIKKNLSLEDIYTIYSI